jgi:hypothetical protein
VVDTARARIAAAQEGVSESPLREEADHLAGSRGSLEAVMAREADVAIPVDSEHPRGRGAGDDQDGRVRGRPPLSTSPSGAAARGRKAVKLACLPVPNGGDVGSVALYLAGILTETALAA